MDSYRLSISGMSCAGCAATVEKHLENIGAEEISVNFAMGEAFLVLPENINADQLAKDITKLGYKSEVHNESNIARKGMSSIERKFWFSLFFLNH